MSASGEDVRLTPEQERLVAASTVIARLVPKVARRTTLYQPAELTSLAYLSLRRAATNYKREKGVPFDGYAYGFVHKDLMRAIEEEHEHQKREQVASFDAAYDHLERVTDPGDIWKDTPSDSRRHVAEFAGGILVTIAARVLSEASRAPSEDDIERYLDWDRRRRKLWNAVAELGDRGRVLVLRYMEGLEWEKVAQALGLSSATVRREHDEVVALLAARLVALRVKKD